MEPDFKALAEAWISNDSRIDDVDGSRRELLVGRIAEALSRRRKYEEAQEQELGLVVNVDRDHFSTSHGLSEAALEQLTDFVQERIDQDLKPRD